ncbi:hypothetical protein ACFE04_031613 [Oxalis oulophora]
MLSSSSSSLQVRIYESNEIPSATEFSTQIEPINVPAVFRGCVKHWKAFDKWNPSHNGLDYLQDRVGSSVVEAMLSRSAPVFYGNLGSHERLPLEFSAFIGFCKQCKADKGGGDPFSSNKCENMQFPESNSEQDAAPRQIYLAQVPIMNTENDDRVQLEPLAEDIQTPTFLETKSLASINLWMNSTQARSSTHYDPHHNVLCVVAGCKQVYLWPPSASSFLYPMPLYGEASNHSSVSLERPDYENHPRAEHSKKFSQRVILNEGDALFLPEGWFHQVDSDDLTIAVNFWWRSNIMAALSEHMDAYYLRRILRRLTDSEMNQVLHKGPPTHVGIVKKSTDDLSCEEEGKEVKQSNMLNNLEPCALQALHELVSSVHNQVNIADQSQPDQSLLTNGSAENDKHGKVATNNSFQLDDDPVAKILWALGPHTLQNVFLAMARNFPRTLEAMVMHLLSPVGAEVLTRKFDDLDKEISEEERNKFYQEFYGAFDDQFAAMDAILKGKESFALQAFKSVLDKFLGVNLDGKAP